jgi:transcriptional regulator with XRE-family HTH domain
MQIYEKLKVMRQCKDWTQEELAEKLGLAVNTYAKIEQGKATIKLDQLKKIAQIMGVDVQELIDTNEKTVFNYAEKCNQSNQHCNIVLTETQCAHELEKAHLIIEQKEKELNFKNEEITLLKQQVEDLRAMLDFLKK